MEKLTQEQLDAPAFVSESQEETESVTPTEESQTQEEVETTEDTETSDEEEQRVPYSRFKTVHEKYKAAEEELDRLRSQSQSSNRQETYTPPEPTAFTGSLPRWWTDLYGDSDASREGYALHVDSIKSIEERASEKAYERLTAREREEQEKLTQNLKFLDEEFETLSASLGRELTESEQASLLDIIDEFTPTGADGKYQGAPISADKAYEIYEMRREKAEAKKRAARTKVAAIAGAKSEGEPSGSLSNFQYGKWDAWRAKVKN